MCLVFVKSRKEKTLLSVIYVCPVTNSITQGRRTDGPNTRQLKPTIMITVAGGDQGFWESKGSSKHPKDTKRKGGSVNSLSNWTIWAPSLSDLLPPCRRQELRKCFDNPVWLRRRCTIFLEVHHLPSSLLSFIFRLFYCCVHVCTGVHECGHNGSTPSIVY